MKFKSIKTARMINQSVIEFHRIALLHFIDFCPADFLHRRGGQCNIVLSALRGNMIQTT